MVPGNFEVKVVGEAKEQTNISSVIMYNRNADDIKLILVREFRSPVNNSTGFVWEFPGGSSVKPNENPLIVSSDEVKEETGLFIEPSRFKQHEARQCAATFSVHKSHLFSVEITDEELEFLYLNDKGNVHGNTEDSERTFVEVVSLKDLLKDNRIDWTTLGQIYSVFISNFLH